MPHQRNAFHLDHPLWREEGLLVVDLGIVEININLLPLLSSNEYFSSVAIQFVWQGFFRLITCTYYIRRTRTET